MTQSRTETGDRTAQKAALLLLAVSLNALECFIPRIPFVPWLKPGIANAVTMIWIVRYGMADTLLYSLLRIWITGFYFGFSLITLSLALSGALLATAGMALTWQILGKRRLAGFVGLGIIGALLHNTGQLVAVFHLFARNSALFYQAPLMIAAALVSGTLVAAVAWHGLRSFDRMTTQPVTVAYQPVAAPAATAPAVAASLALLTAAVTVSMIDRAAMLAASALAATALAAFVSRSALRPFIDPARRFWLLFVFVAAIHLFLSYGTRIPQAPFLTFEGVRATGMQWLRVWTWIQLSTVLVRAGFSGVFLAALTRVFPSRLDTIRAGLLALQQYPAVLDRTRALARRSLPRILRRPGHAVRHGMTALINDIVSHIVDNPSPKDPA